MIKGLSISRTVGIIVAGVLVITLGCMCTVPLLNTQGTLERIDAQRTERGDGDPVAGAGGGVCDLAKAGGGDSRTRAHENAFKGLAGE